MTKWRILLVDDEAEVLDTIKMALDGKYEVVACASGRQALEGIEIIQPDLIVLDVDMPDMDGYTICQRLRADREYRDTPIVFLSALDSREDVKKAYAMGANLYLTKPFDPLRLLKNIDVFMERTPPPFRHKSTQVEDVPALLAGGLAVSTPSDSSALPRALFVFEDENLLGRLAGACEDRFEFVWATNGRDAFDLLNVFEPDVIVLEESLRGLDGVGLTRAVREDVVFCDTPIVFCSDQDGAAERDAARRAGATLFVRISDRAADLIDEVQDVTPAHGFREKKISIHEALDILEFGMGKSADGPEDDEI